MEKIEIEMHELLKILLPNESLSDVIAVLDSLVSKYEMEGGHE